MKYLKKFEIKTTLDRPISGMVLFARTSKASNFEIGDYVILKDTYNIQMKQPLSIWHNHYGQIIDCNDKKSHFLIHLLSFLDDAMINHMKRYIGRNEIDFDNSKITESDIWASGDNLMKFDTKKEFDDAVNQIELEKNTKKYNL